MTNYIWVTAQKEMFHKYPAAPEGVEFLKDLHRHIFHFRIWIQVFGDDRDVEFILFKRFIENKIDKMNTNLECKSCEMICNYLHKEISEKYPDRSIKIEVGEDGENGATYEYLRYK